MIVCSCNRFTDKDVKGCCRSAEGLPPNARAVYARLGCAPKCGECAPTIRRLLRDAEATCAVDHAVDATEATIVELDDFRAA